VNEPRVESRTPSWASRIGARLAPASLRALVGRWAWLASIACPAAATWGALDGVIALGRGGSISFVAGLVAVLHLAALYAPIGVIASLALTLLSAWLERVPTWARLRRYLRTPRALFLPEAALTAALLAELALWGGLFALVTVLAMDFHTRFVRQDLAALLLAGVVVGVVVLLPGLRVIVGGVLVRLLPSRSAIAAPGTWIAMLALGGAALLFAARSSSLWYVYRPLDVAWAPIGLAFFAAAGLALGGRLGRSTRAQAGVVIATTFALSVSAVTYGTPQPARVTVESSSLLGARLLSFYASFADGDGDGHTWAFGGDDCDDADPDIHPGAADPEGDGIDSDCFAGDGAPDVAPRGDGAMQPLPSRTRPFNVLLVTVDTLHRGHLGVNGYERPTSPRIDAFARTATQFTAVMPQSSRSVLSIPSMLTGSYPSEIARGDQYFWPEILPENTTFAEVLRDEGYRTEAYVGTSYFARLRGFYQGFDVVRESPILRSPRPEPVDQTIEALERLGNDPRPFLVWTHLMNVHEPYLGDGTASRFGLDTIAQYDTEIFLADEQVGRLLAALERLGLADDTAVIVASDHGEAFGAHDGVYFHASSLYEDQLASMLFVRVPGMSRPGTSVESPVALLDVMPTILNLAQASAPSPVSGRSLLGCLEGCDETRPIFAELIPDGPFPNNVRKVRRGEQTVIWDVRRNTFQAFDLAVDPEERENVIESAEAEELRDLLRAWVAHSARGENRGDDAYVAQFRVDAVQPGARPVRLRYPDRMEIVACETPETTLHPGDAFRVVCFVRCLDEMDDDLKVVVWFNGPTEPPTDFHGIHVPINGRYHTDQWREGELLRDVVGVVVPPDIRAPSRWDIHIAIDTIDGIRQQGEQGGRPALSARIGTLDIAPR
jgi:choline-sulfatase